MQLEIQFPQIEENYSPYCASCDSCGEQGCCSYIHCVLKAIDLNKECDYPITYKEELIFRDVFFTKAWGLSEGDQKLMDFVLNVYDVSDIETEQIMKKLKNKDNEQK